MSIMRMKQLKEKKSPIKFIIISEILYPDYVQSLSDDDLTKEVTLQIYRNHFEQLIIIILDNAVKYSTTRKRSPYLYFFYSE